MSIKIDRILNTVNNPNASIGDITESISSWIEIKDRQEVESVREFVSAMLVESIEARLN